MLHFIKNCSCHHTISGSKSEFQLRKLVAENSNSNKSTMQFRSLSFLCIPSGTLSCIHLVHCLSNYWQLAGFVYREKWKIAYKIAIGWSWIQKFNMDQLKLPLSVIQNDVPASWVDYPKCSKCLNTFHKTSEYSRRVFQVFFNSANLIECLTVYCIIISLWTAPCARTLNLSFFLFCKFFCLMIRCTISSVVTANVVSWIRIYDNFQKVENQLDINKSNNNASMFLPLIF